MTPHQLCICLLLGAAAGLTGCGGGGRNEGIVPLLVALIRAEFTPRSVSVPNGGTASAQLSIRCDRDGLRTPFGTLELRVKLDPDQHLPAGVQATTSPAPTRVDSDGFMRYDCTADTPDPLVKQLMLDVTVTAAAGTPGGPLALQAYVEIEPLAAGEPSRDATLATLDLRVAAPPPGYGVNLLANPAFSEAVGNGTVPTATGNWTGDSASVVPAEQGISPRSGPAMLRFLSTGNTGAASALQSSQQWQLVDVRELAADIGAGRVRADAGAWFNRVPGTETTDRRFDLRVIAFDGDASTVPARYGSSAWLAIQAASVTTAGNQWQEAQTSLVLPPGTTWLLVEVYAFEDVLNDATGAEFSGHYADDASLVLRLQP